MKRLIMLAVLCAFVLGASAAQAGDLKAGATIITEALWASNWDLTDGQTDDAEESSYGVTQRGQMTLSFVANENLKGVMQLRYTSEWGRGSAAMGAGDSDTITGTVVDDNTAGSKDVSFGTKDLLNVRQVYVDFTWPDTSIGVKVGYAGVSLPSAIGGGSMIFTEEVGSAVVNGDITDNVGFLAGYVRATDSADNTNQALDVYFGALPLNFEGISVTPFFAMAPMSEEFNVANATAISAGFASLNATDVGTKQSYDGAYWYGLSFNVNMFDPFVLKGDLNYGAVTSEIGANERSGWLFDIALEYTALDFMTPEVFFVYTSGEDGNGSASGGDSERMPLLAPDWGIGSFFFGGSNFAADMGDKNDYLGFWALGLSLKDIASFADGLTHTAHIIYAQGTNDKNVGDALNAGGAVDNITYGRTLTEEDSLWEVDFNTSYQVYDELTLVLELGYLNFDADEDVWGADEDGGSAYKVATSVNYSF